MFNLLVCLILCWASHLTAGSDAVGTISQAKGTIQALDSNQTLRTLTVQSPIFANDTIEVGENSFVHLQMIDGSLITLVSNTTYQIESFSYHSNGRRNQFISKLVKGGFRLISGEIGKQNPENYEIYTENGTIGLRGTIVEGLIREDTLYVHVTKGQAEITNEAGTVTIGTGTVEYAVVSRFDELPQTLVSRPAQLHSPVFLPRSR